jgi:hypothetical protein
MSSECERGQHNACSSYRCVCECHGPEHLDDIENNLDSPDRIPRFIT